MGPAISGIERTGGPAAVFAGHRRATAARPGAGAAPAIVPQRVAADRLPLFVAGGPQHGDHDPARPRTAGQYQRRRRRDHQRHQLHAVYGWRGIALRAVWCPRRRAAHPARRPDHNPQHLLLGRQQCGRAERRDRRFFISPLRAAGADDRRWSRLSLVGRVGRHDLGRQGAYPDA